MIQANELRIGNWVVFDNDSFPEQMRFESFAVLYKYPERIVSIKPIPLTPEILEKAGFTKDEDGVYTRKSLYWIDAGVIQIALGYAPVFNCPCKYVHQLQNLYFALTGTELEINLNP